VAAHLGDRVHLDRPGWGEAWPWAELIEVARVRTGTTGRGYLEQFDFQLNVYANSRPEAAEAAWAVLDAVDRRAFAFAAGYLMGVEARTSPRVVRDPDPLSDAPGGRDQFTAYTNFRAMIGRSRAP
jgi:hypothetical protein